MSAEQENMSESSAASILIAVIAAVIVVLLISFLGSRRDGGSFGFAAWPLEN